MIRESLTETFDSAEGEIVADNVNAATSVEAEQVAFNLHDALTRAMQLDPSGAAGTLINMGQMLLSSSSIPEDSLKKQFQMSVDDVQAVASVQPDNSNGSRAATIQQQKTFG